MPVERLNWRVYLEGSVLSSSSQSDVVVETACARQVSHLSDESNATHDWDEHVGQHVRNSVSEEKRGRGAGQDVKDWKQKV